MARELADVLHHFLGEAAPGTDRSEADTRLPTSLPMIQNPMPPTTTVFSPAWMLPRRTSCTATAVGSTRAA
jgi:hypothetical protein